MLTCKFYVEDVLFRPLTVRDNMGTVGYYADARSIEERLDELFTPAGWEFTLTPIPTSYKAVQETKVEKRKARKSNDMVDVTVSETISDGGFIATLSLKIDGEWVAKSSVSEATDIEGTKGADSKSLVRAASRWGLGRYFYDVPNQPKKFKTNYGGFDYSEHDNIRAYLKSLWYPTTYCQNQPIAPKSWIQKLTTTWGFKEVYDVCQAFWKIDPTQLTEVAVINLNGFFSQEVDKDTVISATNQGKKWKA